MYPIKYSLACALLAMGACQPALAQAPRLGNIGDLRGAVVIGVPGTALPNMDTGAPAMRPGSFKRLSDSSASCADLAAEVNTLEAKMDQYLAQINAAQAVSQTANEAMMASGNGGQALSTASGILSMVPGAGLFAGIAGGIASSAAAANAQSNMQEQSAKMMKAQQELAELHTAMANDQGRRDHLVELYLSRGCKLDPKSRPPQSPAQ